MKKVMKEYEVYEFNELEESVKERLIEQEQQWQQEFRCENLLEDFMKEEALGLVNETFENADFITAYYSLGCSQGDGAMIEFNINLRDMNDKYCNMISEEEIELIENVDDINIKVKQSGHYYHERSFTRTNEHLTCYIDNEDLSDEKINDLQNRLDIMFKKFDEDIVDMNIRLSEIGYDFIEMSDEEEVIINILEENNYLKNGEIFQ